MRVEEGRRGEGGGGFVHGRGGAEWPFVMLCYGYVTYL